MKHWAAALAVLLVVGCSDNSSQNTEVERLKKENEELKQQAAAARTAAPTPAGNLGRLAGEIMVITKTQDMKPLRGSKLYFFRQPLESDLKRLVNSSFGKARSIGLLDAVKSFDAVSGLAALDAKRELAEDLEIISARATFTLKADLQGKFTKDNIKPATYTYVVHESFGTQHIMLLDEVSITAGQLTDLKINNQDAKNHVY